MNSSSALAFAIVLNLLCFAPPQALAGAWTLEKHHWQMFSATTTSSANASFGANGRRSPARFQKFLTQNTLEYGLTNAITLFATPAYVAASAQSRAGKVTRATGSSVEAGARILLFAHGGKLSLQG